MKKVLFFALAASVALVACTKNEVKPVKVNQEITFQAVVDKAATKAGTFENSATYPIDRPFGTFAFFYTTSGGYSKNADKYIDNAQVTNTTSETSSAWTTNPKYYWPKQGYLTFMSYSPYDKLNSIVTCEAATDALAEIKIPYWDVDANQTVDIMIADRVDNQTTNGSNGGYTGVPTVFRHKLAQIVKFSIKTKDDFRNLDENNSPQAGSKLFFLKKIALQNIVTNGSFTSGVQPSKTNLGVWTAAETTETNSYTWYENDKTGLDLEQGKEYEFNKTTAVALSSGTIESNGYLLVRPQTFAANDNKKIEITYVIRSYTSATAYSDETVVQSFNIHSATPSWDINKKYSFTITVDLNQIYWAPSVEDWEDGTSTGVGIN